MFNIPQGIMVFPADISQPFVLQHYFLAFGYIYPEPNSNRFFQINPQDADSSPPIKEPKVQMAFQAQSEQDPREQLNIKNIIPNLARKLLGFLYSKQCKTLIMKLYPDLQKVELSRIRAFVSSIKKTIKFSYVGKKSLKKLWIPSQKSHRKPRFYQILRRLSKYYLQKQCILNILLSRRIKPSLKQTHLQYRRKLLDLITEVQI